MKCLSVYSRFSLRASLLVPLALLMFITASVAGAQDYTQLGLDIDGEAAGDNSGLSVSLSSDGSIVAIGAHNNDGAGNLAGHVRVFAWNGAAWVQRGSDIDGEAAFDRSGSSVSLSSDGSVVAIGAYGSDGAGSDAGHVRVFAWNGAAWAQRGSDIDGEAAFDNSGYSVSLSSDGSVVAIGAFLNDGAGSDAGHVRVYAWNGTAWAQRGSDIDGEVANDRSGWSVSLSSDGSVVAIGALYNDGTVAGSFAGHVRVFAWDGAAWAQRGSDIDGEAEFDQSGSSVSLSSDGSVVAIGAVFNDDAGSDAGHVRIFAWDGAAWAQRGSDIDGEAAGDRSGHSVSLSSDGSVVAVGAPTNHGASVFSGHVRIFEYQPEVAECTFDNLPTWDGNLTITGGAAPTASAVLQTPNGFKSIEILPGSDNIGLLNLTFVELMSSTGLLTSSVHGLLYEKLEYTGESVDAPTSVEAVFGPLEQAGSRFLFWVTDQADCTLQVDPVIDFGVPTRIALHDNYPNPFNPSTQISFSLPESEHVRLAVYDLMGRMVKTLVSGQMDAGSHQTTWDGTSQSGTAVASGIYLYRLEAGSVSKTKQMILLK